MTKGIRSSEFWLSLLAALLGALMASGLVTDGSIWGQIAGAILSGLATLGYSASRARVKAADSVAKELVSAKLNPTKAP